MEKNTLSLPSRTVDQKIFKAKVVFVGVDRKSGEYSRQRKFNVNGTEYMVQDGATCFLPEEAMSALTLAIDISATYKNKQQQLAGVDGSDPTDKFLRVENKKFDITILGEYEQVVKDGDKYFAEIDSPEKEKLRDEAKRLAKIEARAELEAELREKIEEEVRERVIREHKEYMEIPEATDDNVIDELLNDDIKETVIDGDDE